MVLERPPAFDAGRAWQVHPQVGLREEDFGALAYSYADRRLTLIGSALLVEVVRGLARYDSADLALAELVPDAERARVERALSRLAASGVISAR
ncbi:MAG TPA: mycofactocin biosynthesis chaperone MftB [Acidimicrobiales bacterium]|nr:mycofactocin biosynthesis chaperone MftB [Acidimicrobiales bacterium]